jgi:hypothetical protein
MTWFYYYYIDPFVRYFWYRGWRKCTYACGWQEPYGFVPEAGCPVHDR